MKIRIILYPVALLILVIGVYLWQAKPPETPEDDSQSSNNASAFANNMTERPVVPGPSCEGKQLYEFDLELNSTVSYTMKAEDQSSTLPLALSSKVLVYCLEDSSLFMSWQDINYGNEITEKSMSKLAAELGQGINVSISQDKAITSQPLEKLKSRKLWQEILSAFIYCVPDKQSEFCEEELLGHRYLSKNFFDDQQNQWLKSSIEQSETKRFSRSVAIEAQLDSAYPIATNANGVSRDFESNAMFESSSETSWTLKFSGQKPFQGDPRGTQINSAKSFQTTNKKDIAAIDRLLEGVSRSIAYSQMKNWLNQDRLPLQKDDAFDRLGRFQAQDKEFLNWVRGMANSKHPETQKYLVDYINQEDADPKKARSIMGALAFANAPQESTFDALLAIAKDRKHSLHANAMLSAGVLGRQLESKQDELFALIQNELIAAESQGDLMQLKKAIYTAGNLGHPRTGELLAPLLKHQNMDIQEAASFSLRFTPGVWQYYRQIAQSPLPGTSAGMLKGLRYTDFDRRALDGIISDASKELQIDILRSLLDNREVAQASQSLSFFEAHIASQSDQTLIERYNRWRRSRPQS